MESLNSVERPLFRMYIDENGDSSLKSNLDDVRNRFLCMTGVVMYLPSHDELTDRMNRIKERFFGDVDIVLHRHEIVPGYHPFEALRDASVREDFNDALLHLMTVFRYRVISVVIDKKELVVRYTRERADDPYAMALEHLMCQYLRMMREFDLKGDILAESRGKREDRRTKEAYASAYAGRSRLPMDEAGRFFSSSEIKFQSKRANVAGLQFADLMSHPARRCILARHGLAGNISAASFEAKIADVLERSKFIRDKSTNEIDGVGATLLPQ